MAIVEITRAIAKRGDEARRLRALSREIQTLAEDAARVERGAKGKIGDMSFERRTRAAAVEATVLGVFLPGGPFSGLEVV